MRPCFAFKPAAAADAPATLSIFDEIGFWGVQAKDFVSELNGVQSKTINVEINSPGGDVFAGLAIYNALKMSGKEIVVKVMGVAASAASLIAMAGDKIVMPKNTFMMIHNPWSFAMGNADELREQADVLDKIGSSLLQTYVARTGKSEGEIAPLLAKDTWLTADEALEMGFATEVVEDVKANASFDMARAELPENVKAVFAAATQGPDDDFDAQDNDTETDSVVEQTLAEQIEAAASAAEMGQYASLWAVACTSMDDLKARVDQAREIKALCAFAKKPEAADAAIKAGKSIDVVRAEMVAAMAQADDATHIDTSKSVNEQATGTTAKSGVTTAAIWASHNGRK